MPILNWRIGRLPRVCVFLGCVFTFWVLEVEGLGFRMFGRISSYQYLLLNNYLLIPAIPATCSG